jgi:TetR/AcrR family transcriptional regulator, cholesterol catabolism regulator
MASDDKTTPGQRRQPRAEGTGLSELIEVSAALFGDRGYDATSIREIADHFGILKGSLYHYVSTKEDLLWMVMEAPLTELVDNATEIFADSSLTLTDRMHLAIAAHCQSFETYHPHMFVITRENGETLSPRRRGDLLALRHRYYDLWKAAIAAGKRSGELRSDIDTEVTAQAVLGMINWMYRWFHPDGRLTAAQVADQFAGILEHGIMSPEPPPERSVSPGAT